MSKRLALIIGNSLYRDEKLTRLVSPDADVGALKDALLDQELGGFDDVNLLFNSATSIVRREIYNFFANKATSDMLLFYFSGHGVLDENGRLYLAVKDTYTSALRGTAIPASYITEEMDNSRSKRQVLILDCCHSGAFERGTKGVPGASVGTASTFEGSGYGRVILTASDATQYAWEGNKVIGDAENSLFTHFIIQGIKTGEADINRDGEITIDEIYDYVYTRIREETQKQTPGKWSFKEQGDMIISHSPYIEISEESPHREIPDDDEKQLFKLYSDGLQAFFEGDWAKACLSFENFLEISPNPLDAKDKLILAKQHKQKQELYDDALEMYNEGNFSESIKLFQNLQSQDPGYKDVDQWLEKITIEKDLASLYSQARKLYERGFYEPVIEIFEKIHKISPDFRDQDEILKKSKNEAKRLNRIKLLEDLYRQAMLDLDADRLSEAKKILLQIQEMEQGYRATDKLLDQIQILITKKAETYAQEEARTEEKVRRDEVGININKIKEKFSIKNVVENVRLPKIFEKLFSGGFKFTRQRKTRQKLSTSTDVKDKAQKSYLKGFLIHLFTGFGLVYARAKTKWKWFYPISFFVGGFVTLNLWDDYYYYDLAPYTFILTALIHFIGLVNTFRTIKRGRNKLKLDNLGETSRPISGVAGGNDLEKPRGKTKKSYLVGFLIHLFTGCGLFYAKSNSKWRWYYPFNLFLGFPIAIGIEDFFWDVFGVELVGLIFWVVTLIIHIVGLVITIRTIKAGKDSSIPPAE